MSDKKESNTIITDWLEKYGDSEIDKKVEERLEQITKEIMSDKKQSSVDFILNAFNLLSDSDFKAWMLNNHDEIKAMHNKEIVDAHVNGNKEYTIGGGYELIAEHYYNETFGGQDNE